MVGSDHDLDYPPYRQQQQPPPPRPPQQLAGAPLNDKRLVITIWGAGLVLAAGAIVIVWPKALKPRSKTGHGQSVAHRLRCIDEEAEMTWPALLTLKQLKAIRAARHNPPTLTAEFEDNAILDGRDVEESGGEGAKACRF